MSWCEVHQRDFSCDTDREPLGCCSLCAVALLYGAEEEESEPITREEADVWGAMFEGMANQ